MKDLGIIRCSDDGKWHWPFKEMEGGDFFVVDPEDRTIGEVRNIAYQNGTRFRRKFSVVTNTDGSTLVRCMTEEEQTETVKVLSYGKLRTRLKGLYRLDADEIAWGAIEDRLWIDADLFGAPRPRNAIVSADGRRFVVFMAFRGIEIERLPDHATVQDWLKRKRRQAAARELFDS